MTTRDTSAGETGTTTDRPRFRPFVPTFWEGDKIKFLKDSRWWQVRVCDERWAIATRQKPFAQKGVELYTIIDRDELLRGPTNLIGQGWDTEYCGGWDVLLHDLQAGEVEISHRNRVDLVVVEVRRPRLDLGKPDARYEVGH